MAKPPGKKPARGKPAKGGAPRPRKLTNKERSALAKKAVLKRFERKKKKD